jgi:mRNA-degrading endonuclease YafQ of YafQ-DinJ toxin-antitoxin module
MSYEIIRASQFKKDYKLMQRRGKDKRKLEEILRILAISPYV